MFLSIQIRMVLSREGLRGLYAGYGAFLLRDLPFDAIEFVTYEQLKVGRLVSWVVGRLEVGVAGICHAVRPSIRGSGGGGWGGHWAHNEVPAVRIPEGRVLYIPEGRALYFSTQCLDFVAAGAWL